MRYRTGVVSGLVRLGRFVLRACPMRQKKQSLRQELREDGGEAASGGTIS